MSGLVRRPGVPGSLGRVLLRHDVPVGTCFQVAPGVLVTAWHVLDGLGRGLVGDEVSTDALDGSPGTEPAEVLAVDPARDLAVLRRARPLAESVPGWAPSDTVGSPTGVVVIGVAEVDDHGRRYAFLQARGVWEGGTDRDGVLLGRLSSPDVMRGMSGAPVVRPTDGMVLGVVSARYNSADGWLSNSVWVARTEDLTRLLEQDARTPVRRRITFGDKVGTVLSVGGTGVVPALEAPPDGVGPVEAAREAALALVALDGAFRGRGGLGDAEERIFSRACGTGWDATAVSGLRQRLRLRGLEPRVLLPRLPDHAEAVERWARPVPGTPPDQELSGHAARAFLGRLRRTLAEEVTDGLLSGLSGASRRFLHEALTDGTTIPLSGFLHALLSHLPPVTSAEAVLRTSTTAATAGPGAGVRTGRPDADAPPGPAPGRPELSAVAAQMCGLPAVDPCVAGREKLVADVVGAIDRHMTRHGRATAFLCGQPGVGTSVVAVEAARTLAPAFPGGVFHVDLHGLLPDARLSARTVVRILAEALGLDLGAEAKDDARLIAAFTAGMHERRVLLILDNALDAAHARPFVKAPAGCAVLVTSRDRAQDYADPGLVFEVGPLDREASVTVLTRCAEGRPPEVTRQRQELHRLAHLCADVPLALRIVGARLAQPSGPPPDYLVRLLEEESARLEGLAYGDRAVRLAIRLSHEALDPPARRVLRLITAAPGAAVTGPELGHCLQAPALRQELLLLRLVDRSLALQDLVRMPDGGPLATFRLFDLVHLFARERLEEDEHPDFVREFQHASVSYLCDRLTEITNQEHGAQLSGELEPTRFHAAQRLARDNDWLDLATDLTVGLHVLYTARRELDAVVAVNNDRVALHLRQNRPEDAVRACLLNIDALRDAGVHGLAAEAARRAASIAREYRLPELTAEAEFRLSLVLWAQEEWTQALAAGEAAVTTLTSTGRGAAAVPLAINNCRFARRMSDSDAAVRWGGQAVELADRWGTTNLRAMAANAYGLAEDDAGRHACARDLYRRAAGLWESVGDLSNAANDSNNAACMARTLNDPADAAPLLLKAVDLWQRAGSHARALEALVDLSALYASQDAYPTAVETLARAEALAAGAAADAPEPLRTEVSVRHAAARLFGDGPYDVPTSPDEDAPVGEEVRGALDALTRHRGGRLALPQAREKVRSLLTVRARNLAPRNDNWVYENLGEEPPDRLALEA
ncbi:trypsin-like peptidase domain-containing protein [Streptomyces sp. NPDC085866]|uniref:trypsin-like peptidase domain-containing protein n=1 Tax=Streptomyces sp. NPDC085866 TaxID=3365736 RepID=UPI0037D33D5D